MDLLRRSLLKSHALPLREARRLSPRPGPRRRPRQSGRVLADQLTRAAISIAANIAEGNGRFAPGDRGQFFGIARGSAHGCVALLELARRRSLVTDEHHAALYSELDEICRMINGLIRGIPRRKAP